MVHLFYQKKLVVIVITLQDKLSIQTQNWILSISYTVIVLQFSTWLRDCEGSIKLSREEVVDSVS